ncbi:MAG: hypothetical protein H3C30_18105 [Candidatus Hydrogenedentes bacterium]|nr:hypothetical protein [Candidatus Hydrogenedentota bacterium]
MRYSIVVVVLILALLGGSISEDMLKHKSLDLHRMAFMFMGYLLLTLFLTIPIFMFGWNLIVSKIFDCKKINYYESLAIVAALYVFFLFLAFPD